MYIYNSNYNLLNLYNITHTYVFQGYLVLDNQFVCSSLEEITFSCSFSSLCRVEVSQQEGKHVWYVKYHFFSLFMHIHLGDVCIYLHVHIFCRHLLFVNMCAHRAPKLISEIFHDFFSILFNEEQSSLL